MAAGINVVFTLEYNGFTVEVAVSETYDILANQSDVSVGLRVKSAYKKGIHYPSGSVKLGGTTLVSMNSAVSTHNIPITAYNTWYDVVKSSDSYTSSPWTMKGIAHNTDGSKTITLDLELRGYDAGGYLGFQVADSRSVTLTHIPRASTIGATDADIGAVSMIAVSRKSTVYTHSIAYTFGSLQGYLTENRGISDTEERLTASGIAFTVPEDFYTQIPNSPTGKCTLTCKTYSGTTQVGGAQTASFTVTANKALCIPDVSGTVADCNEATLALTGDENILIRYASRALCTITAAAKNGASIIQKTIGGVAAEESRTIEAIELGRVVFDCTDSRGYGNSVTVEKKMIPYIHLTANVTAKRTDPTSGKAVLTVSGKYYQGTFGETSNILTIEYCVNGGERVVLEGTLDGSSYEAEVSLSGLDYQNPHSIQVTVSDCLETVNKTVTVGKGIPVFDWGENDFQFHVPVFIQGENALGKINGIALTNCNDAVANGWYYTYGGALNAPTDGAFSMLVMAYSTNAVTQIAAMGNSFSANPYLTIRKCSPSGWTDWEWLNPPMSAGVEYRTAERWLGAPVYTKLVNLGTTTAAMSASVEVSGIVTLIRAVPILNAAVCTGWDADAGINAANKFYFCPEKTSTGVSFYISCGDLRVGKTLYAQLWYTK